MFAFSSSHHSCHSAYRDTIQQKEWHPRHPSINSSGVLITPKHWPGFCNGKVPWLGTFTSLRCNNSWAPVAPNRTRSGGRETAVLPRPRPGQCHCRNFIEGNKTALGTGFLRIVPNPGSQLHLAHSSVALCCQPVPPQTLCHLSCHLLASSLDWQLLDQHP